MTCANVFLRSAKHIPLIYKWLTLDGKLANSRYESPYWMSTAEQASWKPCTHQKQKQTQQFEFL